MQIFATRVLFSVASSTFTHSNCSRCSGTVGFVCCKNLWIRLFIHFTPIQGYSHSLWPFGWKSEALSNAGTIVAVFILPPRSKLAEPELHVDIISKCALKPPGSMRHGLGIQLQDESAVYDAAAASFLNPYSIRLPRTVCSIPDAAVPLWVNRVQKREDASLYTVNTQWQLLNTIPILECRR